MRSVKPLPRTRYSIIERLARAQREAEVAEIARRSVRPRPKRGDPVIPARHASSIVAILDAPRAHARPATGDKQRDKRLAEIAQARATPVLRRRDLAQDDWVTDTTRVVGAKPFDLGLLRRVIAAGVPAVQVGREVRVTPDAPSAAPRYLHDSDTTLADGRPTPAQERAVAEHRANLAADHRRATLARLADARADEKRAAYAMRAFGPAYTDFWFELLPAK